MAVFLPLEEMERAHAAYNQCSEELADALNEVKLNGLRRTREQLQKIAAMNTRCDELMNAYLDAFKRYHGDEMKRG